MASAEILLQDGEARVVGSFGSLSDLKNSSAHAANEACDLAEIRLDLLQAHSPDIQPEMWSHLQEIPLLFTARRREEGGALDLTARERMGLLEKALDSAAWVDIEVASIGEYGDLLSELTTRKIPWLASYHDFEKLPETARLEEAAAAAKAAGAAMFKAAAKMASPADLARLSEFQLADHGIPVSTMGMGALAPVSRLLCAQCGSHFNYGFLGNTATAPGQWDSALLKKAISRLTRFRI
jgi:3-dehydroquinate dehydratase-1